MGLCEWNWQKPAGMWNRDASGALRVERPPSYVGSTLSPLSVLLTLPSGSGVRGSLTAPWPADPEQQEGS